MNTIKQAAVKKYAQKLKRWSPAESPFITSSERMDMIYVISETAPGDRT